MMKSPEHYGYPRVTYTPEDGFTFKGVTPKTHVRKDTSLWMKHSSVRGCIMRCV